MSHQQQLSLFKEPKEYPAKRVNIVSLRMIKEGSVLYKNRTIRSPHDSVDLIKTFVEDLDREAFVVLALNMKNQPTNIQIASLGSLNASIVHPREVMKMAILSNAASIIVFHNHPSGNPTPSPEDIAVTKRLADAGKIIGIDLLDHIIIGENTFLSLKEKGYME